MIREASRAEFDTFIAGITQVELAIVSRAHEAIGAYSAQHGPAPSLFWRRDAAAKHLYQLWDEVAAAVGLYDAFTILHCHQRGMADNGPAAELREEAVRERKLLNLWFVERAREEA